MVDTGDRILVASKKVGQAAREGVVIGRHGSMIRVRWSSGEESSFVPGPGSVQVISHGEPTGNPRSGNSTRSGNPKSASSKAKAPASSGTKGTGAAAKAATSSKTTTQKASAKAKAAPASGKTAGRKAAPSSAR